MWQAVVVAMLVLAAAIYAAWALVPAALRLRLARYLTLAASSAGGPSWRVRLALAIEGNARRRLGHCSACGTVPAAAAPPRDHDEA